MREIFAREPHRAEGRLSMRILAPQIGISLKTCLGGAVTDRAFLYGLADRGHEIDLLLPEGEEADPHPNVRVTVLPRNALFQTSYFMNFYFLPSMKRILQEREIPIVRIHSPYSLGITAPLLRFFGPRKPLLWYSFLHLEARRDWALLDRWLPRFADGITCISEDTRQELQERCRLLQGKVTRVTPLGVDTSLFKRKEIPGAKDPPTVLFVGSLVPRKGVSELLQAWEKVEREFPQARLVIVGQGPLEADVKRFAVRHPTVFHVSKIAHEKLPEIYSKADIFFFPTRKEGFGLVVAEAMACGLPVVTAEAPGVRQLVIDGETGFKRPIGAVDQFSERILYLLKHPEASRRMGRLARERAEHHLTWDHGISETESFIEELAKRSN